MGAIPYYGEKALSFPEIPSIGFTGRSITMSISPRPTIQLGDMTLRFQWDDASVRVGLEIYPTALMDNLVPRHQTLGSYRFFQKICERLPDLVIENCSSGGHRLEPSMLGLSAMSSFSDAHKLVEILALCF